MANLILTWLQRYWQQPASQRINHRKIKKINYLLIGIVTLLAVALRLPIPGSGAENRIAAIQEGSCVSARLTLRWIYSDINGKPSV